MDARLAGRRILNMSSSVVQHPQREHFATLGYAASKGAVEAMTLSDAAYYAGIRINAIAPGLVRTPMSARAQGDPRLGQSGFLLQWQGVHVLLDSVPVGLSDSEIQPDRQAACADDRIGD